MRKSFELVCMMLLLAVLLTVNMVTVTAENNPEASAPGSTGLDRINKAIQSKGAQWTAGVTSKSGLSPEQKATLCGLKLPPKEEVIMAAPLSLPEATPPAFDWRDYDGSDWITSVKDQGGCGSCWAFAALGSVEAVINIKAGDPGIDADLAEQQLVSDCCTSCGDCSGGWPSSALDYVRDIGVPEEICFPYEMANSPCEPCANWLERVSMIDWWAYVNPNTTEAYKAALVQYGPLVVVLNASDDFFSYVGGIYEPVLSDWGAVPNHAVVLVGYDDNLGPNGCWIIKNSWGTNWGDSGYCLVKYGALEQYDWAWVIDGASVPEPGPPLGSISGVIQDQNGNPVSGIPVQVWRYDATAPVTDIGTGFPKGTQPGNIPTGDWMAEHLPDDMSSCLSEPQPLTIPPDFSGETGSPELPVYQHDWHHGPVLGDGSTQPGIAPSSTTFDWESDLFSGGLHEAPFSMRSPPVSIQMDDWMAEHLPDDMSSCLSEPQPLTIPPDFSGETGSPELPVYQPDWYHGAPPEATSAMSESQITAVTGVDGSYTITGLPSGSYLVFACSTCSGLPYVNEYYENTYNYYEATPVAVTAPNDTSGIDFIVEIAGTITGHVYEADGRTAIGGVPVFAEMLDGSYSIWVWTGSDGSYTISGLPSGSYRVFACSTCSGLPYISEYYENSYDYSDAIPVLVTAPNNTPGIDFTLDVGGTITGHVYQIDGTTPISGAWVSAGMIGISDWAWAVTGSDGTYTITGLRSGDYRVSASASGFVGEYYQNTYNYYEATPVAVTAPNNTPGIDFTLEKGGSISGIVTDANGNPIQGASVYAYGIDFGWGYVAETAADGTYTITGLRSGDYRVSASANGFVGEYYQNTYDYSEATPVAVTAPNNTPGIDFALQLSGTITGHVYQADGTTPIEAVQVWAGMIDNSYSTRVWTSSDGGYIISGLPSGSYRVFACSTCSGLPYVGEYYQNVYDYGDATPVSVTAPNNTPGIDFTLDKGGSISGIVTDANGNPIGGASVYAYGIDFGWGYVAETAADGTYTITGLRSGDYRVSASASGFVGEYYQNTYDYFEATPVAVTAPNNTPGIDFTLEKGGSISGIVTDSNGDPISGAWVSASGVDVSAGESASTNSDGTYTITGLRSGNYRVYSSANGFIREYYQNVYDYGDATPVSVTAPNNTPGIDFTLDKGGSISGIVTDSNGDPISGAWVNASGVDMSAGESASTNSDGTYTITGLRSGDYRVSASANGFVGEYYQNTYDYSEATPVAVTATNNTPGIDFTLDKGGSISGTVTDVNGDPISGAWVIANMIEASYGAVAVTAADGTYSITGLPSGNYRVRCEANGFVGEYYLDTYDWNTATPVSVTVPSNTPGIDFTLEKDGSISGTVTDYNGDPVQGAWVYASGIDFGVGNGTNTAADGTYSITALLSGSYRVECQASGFIGEYYQDTYDWNTAMPVLVTATNNTPGIDFTLDKGGSISGIVTDANGNPIGGASVYAYGIDFGWGYVAETAADGTYTITGLRSGNYRVECQANGYIRGYYQNTYDYSEATPVAVTAPNNTPGIDFTLEKGGSISGIVTDSNSDPIAGAWVSASGIDFGGGNGASTAADGTYTIDGLRSDNYRVECEASGFIREYYQDTYDWNTATPVSVTAPNDTPGIDFTLEKGGSISGIVTDANGDPISGAWVNAEMIGTSYAAWAPTNTDGTYTITGLRSGDYRVSASANGFVGEYYQNTYDYSEATPVAVTAPNNTPGIDFTLDKGGSISGIVTDANGDPISGAWVNASGVDMSAGESASTNSDGTYTITGLRSGNYRVECQANGYIREYYQNTYDYSEATPVAVTAPNNTPGIDFTLDKGGSISGHVYEADGTTPVAGAWVYASGNGSGSSYTAPDGSYSIAGLRSGAYGVQVSAEGFIHEFYDGAYDGGDATLVYVTAPHESSGIDFTLDKGGVISGHVYEADGITPIPAAKVYAFLGDDEFPIPVPVPVEPTFASGAVNLVGGIALDETGGKSLEVTEIQTASYSVGADGSYTITGLRSGSYRVRCEASGFIGEYYQDTYDWNTATPVVVTAPNDTPGIDFTLEKGGSISGTVTDVNGDPIAGAWVYASGIDLGWGDGTNTAADGTYSITGLPSDSYWVGCQASGFIWEYYQDTYDWNTVTLVSVTAPNNTPGIDFTLDKGGSISGIVTDANGNPIQGAWVNASGVDVSAGESASTNSDGTYTITGLRSGNYRVECQANGYIREYYQNVYDYGDATPVSVTAPNNTPGIDFTLDKGGSISGHVYQADGTTPIAGVPVLAGRVDTSDWITGALTGTDGSYTITGFPSGSYQVRAVGSLPMFGFCLPYKNQWYDHAQCPDDAIPVWVTAPNDTPGIDFSLQAVPELATVDISMSLQGSSRPDPAGWEIPITVKFFCSGADVLNDLPIYELSLFTTKSGNAAVCQVTCIPPGTYDITVVSEHTLMNVKRNVVITGPTDSVDMGTLLEGDWNGNLTIDWEDLGTVLLTYDKCDGNEGFDPAADFNRNGCIDWEDLGLVLINYDKTSPVEVP